MSASANQVPYWGYYTSGIGFDEDPRNTNMGQQFLAGLRKFDPNANFVEGTSGGGEGGPGQTNWTLQYDSRKTPDFTHSIDMNAGDFNPQYYSQMDHGDTEAGYLAHNSHSFDTSQLYNPNAIGNSPTLGQITSTRNLKPDAGTWVDKFGPMLVGGFGGLLGGAGMLSSLLQKAPGVLNSITHGQFNPFQVAGMALPYVPGVSPFMANLGRIGLNYIGSGRKG